MAGRQGEQELMELQQKLMMVSRDLNEVQVKINLNQRNKRRAELTQAELQGLAPDAKTYKSTGRMFLMTPLDGIKTEIAGYITQCDDNLTNLDKKGAYLAKQLQDYEASFREMAK